MKETTDGYVWANNHLALTASLKNVSTFPETSRGLRAAKDKIHSDLNSLSSLFTFYVRLLFKQDGSFKHRV